MRKVKDLNNGLYKNQVKSLVVVRKFEETHPDFVELIDVFKRLTFIKKAVKVVGDLPDSISEAEELCQGQLSLFWPEAV